MDPFENRNSALKDDLISEQETPPKRWVKPVIILSISLSIIIIVSLLIYFIAPLIIQQDPEPYGEIKCIYYIQNSKDEINILNDEFENFNNSIKNIYINETQLEYKKNYKFNSDGIFEIKFILNEKIYLDNIFKDIEHLQKVQLYTNSSYQILSMQSAFENSINLKDISISGFKVKNLKSISNIFKGKNISNFDLSNFKTNNIIVMSFAFSEIKNEFLKLSFLSTKNVQNMSHMFYNSKSLIYLDISNFDTKNANDMSYLFSDCVNIERLNLNNFETSKVTNMAYMFNKCVELKNLNIDNFNTEQVTNMTSMFQFCFYLKNINLSLFDTQNVEICLICFMIANL